MSICAQYLEGAAILRDWLGEGGKPVPRDVSEKRASICAICPKNQHPKWWEKTAETAAETMRIFLSHKASIALTTSHDDDLGMCVVCKCCLPLKVHTPIEHVLFHTSEEVMNALPEHCWVKTKEA